MCMVWVEKLPVKQWILLLWPKALRTSPLSIKGGGAV